MVNSVTDKFSKFSTLSKYSTYANFSVPSSPSVLTQSGGQVKDTSELKQNKGKQLLPLGLIAGGGVLLYLGLRRPSPRTMYTNFINGKLFNVEKKMRVFTASVKNSLDKVTAEATNFIDSYKTRRFIDPADNLGPLKSLTDPRHLIHAQDIAFETIIARDHARTRMGATDFGNFSSLVTSLIRTAKGEMADSQRLVKLDFGDILATPIARNEKYVDLIEECENRLISMINFSSEQTGKIIDEQTLAVVKHLHMQMANAVLEARKRVRHSKMNIIDETYSRMRSILGVNNLRPTYNMVPEATGFAHLTEAQLKPTKLPAKLRKAVPYNAYLKALQTKDFSNLTDEDIREIFYSAPYENNLQDLGFLIDRLRLRQAVDKAKSPDRASSYDVIVPKLEYLSKRLHEFGKRELFGVLDKDFDHMRLEKKRASVYYVLRVARRLGFDSIQDMDAMMLKENSAYADLNIRKYIQIFKDNPDLYFS